MFFDHNYCIFVIFFPFLDNNGAMVYNLRAILKLKGEKYEGRIQHPSTCYPLRVFDA